MSIGIGVIGAGTVGGGVIEILRASQEAISARAGVEVRLAHVAEKDAARLAQFDLEGVTVSGDGERLIEDPHVDVVLELIGGLEPAKTFILSALRSEKHVVTANKMLLAYHGAELNQAAMDNAVALRYEAAVAGTIPIIKAVREGLIANRITGICGILNGTCNYILTQMAEHNLEFQDALDQAVAKGFAETPPDLDIEGHDTAHKCQILASLAASSRVALEAIHTEGITKITYVDVVYARELGYETKLLAVIADADGAIDARVHPTLVPREHLLASVRNEFNAVFVESDYADATLYFGRGAGRMPTASAVVADVVDIARHSGASPTPAFIYTQERPVRAISERVGPYYLRVTTADVPGALGRIAGVLGAHNVSILSCFQKAVQDPEHVHVVLMTHDALEADVTAAVSEIDGLEFVRGETQMLRVLGTK